jgi:hypothetical protein
MFLENEAVELTIRRIRSRERRTKLLGERRRSRSKADLCLSLPALVNATGEQPGFSIDVQFSGFRWYLTDATRLGGDRELSAWEVDIGPPEIPQLYDSDASA